MPEIRSGHKKIKLDKRIQIMQEATKFKIIVSGLVILVIALVGLVVLLILPGSEPEVVKEPVVRYSFPNSDLYADKVIGKASPVPSGSINSSALEGYGDPMWTGVPLNQYDPGIANITASGTLVVGRTFSPAFVNDIDYTTWWSPGAPNKDGRDAWIKLALNSDRMVKGFRIWAGAHYNPKKFLDDLYEKNNRVALIEVVPDSGAASFFYLPDVNAMQECTFKEPVKTRNVQFKIREIYKGAYNDLCISHLELIYN